MHNSDINEILAKISETRAVFMLGQRALPFLEEVFHFFREITPLLDEINQSIRDSTAKMPRATTQLMSVTEATELATTEILDLVDGVLDQLGILREHLSATAERIGGVAEDDRSIEDAVSQALRDCGTDVPDDLQMLFDERRKRVVRLQEGLSDEGESIADIRSRINRIMISLQVQDITSQQIASVNHLIESIRDRMTALVEQLGGSPASSSDNTSTQERTTFDPDARYDRTDQRQNEVDRVVSQQAGGSTDDGPVTDDLIDQLFTACTADPPRPTGTPDVEESNGDSGPASQAEIDALFNGGRS
ncbi:MAG: protein phosphatase CheZ [Bacteroidota bacterium]